jgi:osmotically-inducible protein OsmY
MKSAEMLQRDVLDELAWDPAVDSSHIGVLINDSVVTLSGHVGSYAEKLAAEKAARRIAGVKAVVDDLDVRYLPERMRNDAAIAQAAVNAFRWNVNIPPNAVSIVVESGWVKLEGEVLWFYQKTAAEKAVRNLHGVKGITNLITVKQKANPADVKSKIEAAFKRNAQIDAGHIEVKARDGKVTLSGTVSSWAETLAAENAAWSAPGVTHVENHLKIEVPITAEW